MNLSLIKPSKSNWIIVLFGSLLFSYTFYRAVVLSITWDEGYSYYEFIKNKTVLLDNYESMAANNHLLNTLGGLIFSTILGVNEFSLRIFSLIAHLIFIVFSAKLVSKFGNKWITISAFLILNLNPYMLDFFSLARGYAISLGFMMASIYYFYRLHVNEDNTKNAFFSILFAAIGTLGNFTLLNYSVVLFGLICVLILLKKIKGTNNITLSLKGTAKEMLFPTLLMVLFLWFVLPITFGLKAAGALYFGGENGLWKDTLGTIIPRLWYDIDYFPWLHGLTKAFVLLILFVSPILVVFKFTRKKVTHQTLFLSSLLTLFFLILLSTVVQHYLLNTLYLVERAVLFLFVLLLLIFVFFINELITGKNIAQVAIHFFATLVLIHFLFSFNLKYVCEWKDDCETKEMLADLEKIRGLPNEKFNISIGVPLSFESSINYYRIVNHWLWLNPSVRSNKINYLNDYFFLRPVELKKVNKDSIEIIKTYPITKNCLVKAKYPFKKATVIFDSIHQENGTGLKISSDLEYSPGISYYLPDSLNFKNSILSCKIDFQTEDNFSGNVFFITSYQNKNGAYSWTSARINDFFYETNKHSSAMYSSFIPAEAKAGDELKVYLWNPYKQKLVMKKLQLKLINYSANSSNEI